MDTGLRSVQILSIVSLSLVYIPVKHLLSAKYD